MPRNFSELKSGGGQFLCCPPHAEKCGDASPRPPPIDARAHRGVDPVLKVGGRGTNLYIHICM